MCIIRGGSTTGQETWAVRLTMTSIALGGEVTGRDKWCSRAEEERSLVDSTIWFGDGSVTTARR